MAVVVRLLFVVFLLIPRTGYAQEESAYRCFEAESYPLQFGDARTYGERIARRMRLELDKLGLLCPGVDSEAAALWVDVGTEKGFTKFAWHTLHTHVWVHDTTSTKMDIIVLSSLKWTPSTPIQVHWARNYDRSDLGDYASEAVENTLDLLDLVNETQEGNK